MGYGGTRAAAERLGQSGDGGVDGVIREDPLGLDLIYVQGQALGERCWSTGDPEVRRGPARATCDEGSVHHQV